jgi:hypothetical protein
VVVVVLADALSVGEEAGLFVDSAPRGVHQIQHRSAAFQRALLHPEEFLDAAARHRPSFDGEIVRHEMDVPPLELGGPSQETVSREPSVRVFFRHLRRVRMPRVEVGEPAILEREIAEPEL